MRFSTLSLFAAAALSTTAAGGAQELGQESVAMLQTAGRQGLEQRAYLRHREALDKLLESTENMLKKGASSDVIALAQETLRALKAEVLPMIATAHEAQTGLLTTHYEAAMTFLNSYAQELQQLSMQRTAEGSASAKHKACRLSEVHTVTQRKECSDELALRWEKVTELEEDLTNIEERITEEWCVTGLNTSVWTFRENSVRHFDKYSAKKTKVTVSWKAYHDYVPQCQTFQEENHEVDEQCDTLQQDLEEASCLGATLAGHTARTVDDTWPVVRGAFQDTVASVTEAVGSRKHEYSILRVVECLIEKIQEVGGLPCEEQEAGTNTSATVEIEHCHEISENVTHLDIIVPVLPPDPSVPEAQPEPCTDAYIAQEYGGFPEGVEVAECRPCISGELAPPIDGAHTTPMPVLGR